MWKIVGSAIRLIVVLGKRAGNTQQIPCGTDVIPPVQLALCGLLNRRMLQEAKLEIKQCSGTLKRKKIDILVMIISRFSCLTASYSRQ